MLERYLYQSEIFTALLKRTPADIYDEVNRCLKTCFTKLFYQNKEASELFHSDVFARSQLVMLEQQLKMKEFTRVDDFEAFIDSFEHWSLTQVSNLNRFKKEEFARSHKKLSELSASSIERSLVRMSVEERKHFILKNQKFI